MQAGIQEYIGGLGADSYIYNSLPDLGNSPDTIFDFRPEEGDQIILKNFISRCRIKPVGKYLEVNRKGKVTLNFLDGKKLPLLNFHRSNLKLEVKKSVKIRY